jgi:hypothetical protein
LCLVMMDARLVVCWFNMVAIELLVECPHAKSIWNSAARRYDIVQCIIDQCIIDQCIDVGLKVMQRATVIIRAYKVPSYREYDLKIGLKSYFSSNLNHS